MKKQEYIDFGLHFWLSPDTIERTLCKIFGMTPEDFFCKKEFSSMHIYETAKMFFSLKNGKPESYLLQSAEFYGHTFHIHNTVLIPRNDTEVLVKVCLDTLLKKGDTKNTFYVDVWTGSACIAISVIKELEPLRFTWSYALDISESALEIARKNIESHQIDVLHLQKSNLLESLYNETDIQGKKLCITANLPYIKEGDYENMDQSVRDHEPDIALYGGAETGFELYQKLIKQCFQIQQIHALESIDLFIEIGFDQKEYSEKYLQELGLSFTYFPDNAGKSRVIYIYGF